MTPRREPRDGCSGTFETKGRKDVRNASDHENDRGYDQKYLKDKGTILKILNECLEEMGGAADVEHKLPQ
jgi:hypothetical protein